MTIPAETIAELHEQHIDALAIIQRARIEVLFANGLRNDPHANLQRAAIAYREVAVKSLFLAAACEQAAAATPFHQNS